MSGHILPIRMGKKGTLQFFSVTFSVSANSEVASNMHNSCNITCDATVLELVLGKGKNPQHMNYVMSSLIRMSFTFI